MIKDRIGHLIEIDWLNDLHDLQPDNVKLPYNSEHLKNSIKRHGFSLPFAVWNDNGKYYCIDGHHRKQILTELVADGIDVPRTLKAYTIEATDKKDAIKILVEVHNQKHNPFAEEFLTEWLEVEMVDVEMIGVNFVESFDVGSEYNKMNDEDIDLEEEFDPIGNMSGKQRVLFLFDGPEEAESYLKSLKVNFKKNSMAWQVDLSTLSI